MRIVVKLSGKVLEDATLTCSLASQVAQLSQEGHQIILIHGGGKQLSAFCRRSGIPVVQHHGRRVTDLATIEAAQMVFSSINRSLTAQLSAKGVPAVGLSAFDGNITTSARRKPVYIKDSSSEGGAWIDFGYVGEITSVNPSLIETLWASNCIPVLCCLCCDSEGQVLNINADTLAAEIAPCLSVDRVISVSDVDGIYADPMNPKTKIHHMDVATARNYLAGGVFLDGMIPKVENAIRLVENGACSFQVLSGLKDDALLNFFTPENGTLLTQSLS
ncbi:MAG: acetylglutamate kinase [Candidatus Bathyarchaeota archaeon]|nr:acetylglutamate kinase [Candidatus Bathyarchaeota archaeon]